MPFYNVYVNYKGLHLMYSRRVRLAVRIAAANVRLVCVLDVFTAAPYTLVTGVCGERRDVWATTNGRLGVARLGTWFYLFSRLTCKSLIIATVIIQ